MNIRKTFSTKWLRILTALLVVFTLMVPLSAGQAAAAVGGPKTPFKWTDDQHSQITDANNNVYYPVGYFCAGNSTLTNKDATAIDNSSATSGLTDANRITEAGGSPTKVQVGKCDSKVRVGNYLWATQTSPHYAFGVYSPDGKYYDTRYCPVGSGKCSAAVFKLSDGTSTKTVLFASDIKSVSVDATKSALVDPAAAAAAADKTGGPGDTPTAAPPTKVKCEAGNPLDWILCPVFNLVGSFSDFLFRVLFEPLLRTAPISTDPNTASYRIWSNFRIYGDIFLVIALLVIVFGQSIGGGLVDAYTAKKVLPRLLAAAILINLSIYIVAIMVDLTNILGGGLGAIITGPLNQAGAFVISPSGVQSGVIAGIPLATLGISAAVFGVMNVLGALGGVFIAALPLIGLFIILPAALGLLVAFITLIFRKAILLALILVSPVAFALYCLPNTEKYFQKWWSLFIKTLAVYPIVIVIFAVSDVLAVTVTSANSSSNPVAAIISFVLQFLPLFLIPFAFKMAGGAVGQIGGILTGFSKRASEGIKGDARNPNSMRNRAKRRFGEKFTATESRMALPGQSSTATRRQQRAMRAVNRLDRGWNSRSSNYSAEATKREDQISATGHDAQRYAANYFTVGAGDAAPVGVSDGGTDVSGSVSSSTRYFDGKGRAISEGFAKQSAAIHASSEYDSGRNLEYTLRKANTDDDLANYRRAFGASALRQGLNEDEVAGLHARASFEHKDKFPSEWHSSPKLIKGTGGNPDRIQWADIADAGNEKGQAAQVNELHKAKQSFQLSSLRGRDLRSWSDRRNKIQDQLDAGVPLRHDDAVFFAQTDELMGSLVNQGVITQAGDDGPQMSAQGVSAESAGVLRAMAKNRRYKVTEARSGVSASGDPLVSVNERVIYNEKAVDAAVYASRAPAPAGSPPGTPPGPPSVSRDDVIDRLAVPIAQPAPRGSAVPGIIPISTIGKTVAVTGDAQGSVIPRRITK